jgi:Family of unknown function (DUF6879)
VTTTLAVTLDECFEKFEATAQKMEALPVYDVPFEADALRLFCDRLAGVSSAPMPERSVRTSPWLARIQQTTLTEGKSWSRTRIVGWPLTEYELFELSYSYPPSVDAGEMIQVADRSAHPELAAPLDEFWLFDAEGPHPFAAMLDYSDGGAWLGCQVTDNPRVIRRCLDQVRLAAQFAVPLAAFLSRHGG